MLLREAFRTSHTSQAMKVAIRGFAPSFTKLALGVGEQLRVHKARPRRGGHLRVHEGLPGLLTRRPGSRASTLT